ncbi:MAG: hypothetical protein ABEJ72_01065, partial [Candidatus Aenigmatarchaeota archaeon]
VKRVLGKDETAGSNPASGCLSLRLLVVILFFGFVNMTGAQERGPGCLTLDFELYSVFKDLSKIFDKLFKIRRCLGLDSSVRGDSSYAV